MCAVSRNLVESVNREKKTSSLQKVQDSMTMYLVSFYGMYRAGLAIWNRHYIDGDTDLTITWLFSSDKLYK
jgi:hypothetical protein